MTWLTLPDINPEPWTAPGMGVKRFNGKMRAVAFKSAALKAYQEAVGHAFEERYPDWAPLEGDVSLGLYLWRQLPTYEGSRGWVRKHTADATNLQKALEDALQGRLFANDRQVREVRTVVVEQGFETRPFIAIQIGQFEPSLRIPLHVSLEQAEAPMIPALDRNLRDVPKGIF